MGIEENTLEKVKYCLSKADQLSEEEVSFLDAIETRIQLSLRVNQHQYKQIQSIWEKL